MQRRICDKCGTRFNWQSSHDAVMTQVREHFYGAIALFGIWCVIYEVFHTWVAWWIMLSAFFLLLLASEALLRELKSRSAVVRRKCPQCSSSSGVAVDSPAGQEFQLRWKDVHAAEAEKATEHLFCTPDVRLTLLDIEKGANVNARDSLGRTPLSEAAQRSPVSVLNALLGAGASASVNVADNEGRTPLMWAARDNSAAMVRVLLRRGANVHAKDATGSTPLMWAVRGAGRRSRVATKLLLAAGADVNAEDGSGATALENALRSGDARTVKILLDAGARPKTALQVA